MINVNSFSLYSSKLYTPIQKTNLKEQTIHKLLLLGIDINTVNSEQAKKIIDEEENKRNLKNGKSETIEKKQNVQENLFNRIKNFASKLGIQINTNQNTEDIIYKIENKLNEMKKNNNPNINIFTSEFESLKLQFKNINNIGPSFLNAMDMMSGSNRAALGL